MPKVKKIVQPPDVQQSLGGHQQAGSFVGIEAVELPRAVVMKLAKSTGPGNMKLAKEVPVALTKASTVFINYLVAIAHEIAAARSEKSLNARHVLEACRELQWCDTDELLKTMKLELDAFRKYHAEKKVQKAVRSETADAPEAKTKTGDRDRRYETQTVEDHPLDNQSDDDPQEEEEEGMQIDELSHDMDRAGTGGTDSGGDEGPDEQDIDD